MINAPIIIGGGSSLAKFSLDYSDRSKILAESNAIDYVKGSGKWGNFDVANPNNLLKIGGGNILDLNQSAYIYYDLVETNRPCSIYGIISLGGYISGSELIMGAGNSSSNYNCPLFFVHSTNTIYASIWGGDISTGTQPFPYHALALTVNAAARSAKFYIDGKVVARFTNLNSSGNAATYGVRYKNGGSGVSPMRIMFAAVVDGEEPEETVIANTQRLSNLAYR